tara:strand:+ start:541 stop:2268 length:1728 start_codon:yes stop_codon:yes gene_type:complete
MSIILGLNCEHADSAACLIKDNKIIAAVEEERLSRTKHHFGFPYKSIEYCLNLSNLNIEDIDFIAVNSDPNANFLNKIKYVFKNPESLLLAFIRILKSRKRSLRSKLKKIGYKKKIKFVEHHLSHIISSYSVSSFKNAVVLSIDGFGDFTSLAWGEAKNHEIKIEKRILFPNSMGIFYSAVTQHLGFLNYGDEYKVMGMSSYGEEKYKKDLKKIISYKNDGSIELDLKYFNHHKKDYFKTEKNAVKLNQLFSKKINNILGPKRNPNDQILQKHFDLARSLQEIYEDYLINLIKFLKEKYKDQSNLCLSGGCINNSLANGKISNSKIFEKIYICSSPGDSGGAIGAAIHASKYSQYNFNGLSGSSFENKEIKNFLIQNNKILDQKKIKYMFLEEKELIEKTVEKLIENKIIGWFSGGMEFGPRALGNRSIICNPNMADARSVLNEKIKLREKFRPFAGSVLEHKKNDWFDCPIKEFSPFMSKVYEVYDHKKKLIPSIVHNDGTCRIQTVNKNDNLRYYNLIEKFYEKTDIPILLNTSFNENEPIVCTPQEALDCYTRTNMDYLVMENYFFYREYEN